MNDDPDIFDGLALVTNGQFVLSVKLDNRTNPNLSKETTDSGQVGFASIPVRGSIVPFSYKAENTIALGDFEFARLGVGICALASPSAQSIAQDWSREYALALLADEIHSIGKGPAGPELPVVPPEISGALLTLHYGLTLKVGKFESAKVDLEITMPSDVDNLVGTWKRIEKDISARVDREVDRLRGIKKNVGL